MYFSSGYTISLLRLLQFGWVVEGINTQSLSCCKFLEGAHQCQIDIVLMACVLCSLLASFCASETTDSANCPICPLHRIFLVCWDLQGWSSWLVLLVLPGAGWGHCAKVGDFALLSSSARMCKAHTSSDNIQPWQSSTARLLYHHSTDHAAADGVFYGGVVLPAVCSLSRAGLASTVATCCLSPSARLLCQRSKMQISYA